jgi:TPR repeat protein
MILSKMFTFRWLTAALILLAAIASQAQDGNDDSIDMANLKRLAGQGNADAQFELGVCYLRGAGVAKDFAKGAEWLKKASDQHHLPAINALGTVHEEGLGVEKDEKKAFELYQRAAKFGLALAQQNLAECYESGRGVEKDEKAALEWLEKAAQQDFGPSQAAYAWKLEKGAGGAEKNTKEAAVWYLKAAQDKGNMGGITGAMTHLAYLYYTGVGVPLDYRRAEAWYRRAARTGDPWALNDIAWFLAVCPDESFHSADEAVEYARTALEKMTVQDYQVVDTLAAALARSGQYGEAVQAQAKAIVLFTQDREKSKSQTPEDRAKLEKELADRLESYKQQKAFIEKNPPPEEGTKPLIEDRILQEEQIPRRKPKADPNRANPDRRSPVIS